LYTAVTNSLVKYFRTAGHVAGIGERRGAYMVLVGKPERRRPLGRPRRRWEDNIKMDLREVGWRGGMDWKLTGPQLVKKFPAFYGTRMFITAFTRASRLSLY
jgi:hypothetical protein